jgi:predicted enzyme related to lactoylglutathione lyase
MFDAMDVMDAGRMTFLMHPAGGAVGVWQPARHTGAELVNEPGALTWNQLHTRDQAGAAAFYEAVFGWKLADFGGMPIFNLGDRGIASVGDMPPGTPDEVPAFWMTIFASADTDATAAKAAELGGRVLAEPFDIEGVGRFAVLADPQGAAFGVITAPPEGT